MVQLVGHHGQEEGHHVGRVVGWVVGCQLAHPRRDPDVVAEHQDAGLQAHQVEEEALGAVDLGVSRPNQEDPQLAIHQVGAEVE